MPLAQESKSTYEGSKRAKITQYLWSQSFEEEAVGNRIKCSRESKQTGSNETDVQFLETRLIPGLEPGFKNNKTSKDVLGNNVGF